MTTGAPRARNRTRGQRREHHATSLLVAIALRAAACTHHPAPAHDAGIDVVENLPDVPPATDAAVPLAIEPAATLVGSEAVRLDSTERLHVIDDAGRSIRPGGGAGGIGPVEPGSAFYPGDRIESGAHGARVRLANGAELAMGENARVLVPEFPQSDLVVSRGAVRVLDDVDAGASPGTVLDAPAARIMASSAAVVVVADDGSTLVGSLRGDATVEPSPPAPASTLGPRIHREHHGTPGHPVSLDVQVNELELQRERPLDRLTLSAGHGMTFAPDGRPEGPRAMSLDEASLAHWRASAEREIARLGMHTVPIAQLSRAGAGDLADVRALTARLARARARLGVRGATVDASASPGLLDEGGVDGSDAMLERLSAALGRAQARADRGRILAERGGDVTSLVALAPFEDLLAAAREVMGPRVRSRMLDTRPRARVP